MRTISADALAKLTTQYGVKPYLVLGVTWIAGGIEYLYADRDVSVVGVSPRIIELQQIDNVLNAGGNGGSGSITIKLDDIDGTIKNIMDVVDIHLAYGTVYQCFDGLSIDEKFVIFEGQINSPISWSEGDRTVTFTLLTFVESQEVGFSAEEGYFPLLPTSFIGEVWPLAFGNARHVPGLCFQTEAVDTTASAYFLPDRTVGLVGEQAQIQAQAAYNELQQVLQLTEIYAAEAAANGDRANQDTFEQQIADLASQMAQLKATIQNYERHAAALQDETTLRLAEVGLKVPIINNGFRLVNGGRYFPKDQPLLIEVGDFKGHGMVSYGGFLSFNPVLPPTPSLTTGRDPQTGALKMQFLIPQWTEADIYVNADNQFVTVFTSSGSYGDGGQSVPPGYTLSDSVSPEGIREIAPGSSVKVIGNITQDWIVNIIPTNVIAVWAFKSVGDVRTLSKIPASYWTQKQVFLNTFYAEVVELKRPLSCYAFEAWEDQIYVDQVSSIGPNVADVLIWFITSYTIHTYDEVSFNLVRDQTAKFPCNFYLNKRGNILSILSEIAYQSCCSIFLRSGVFTVVYLPAEPATVDTITEADIVVGSLAILSTETEDLITKMKAQYTIDYSQEQQQDVIVFRNNINKYGMLESDQQWYIYTDAYSVQNAAAFWMMRKSNTFKRVQFKTMLHKLRLEPFDAITLDFSSPYIASGPVTAVIETVTFDPVDCTIDITCWTPVLFGSLVASSIGFPIPFDTPEVIYFPYILQQFAAQSLPNIIMPSGSLSPILGNPTDQINYDLDSLANQFVVPISGQDAATNLAASQQSLFMIATNYAFQPPDIQQLLAQAYQDGVTDPWDAMTFANNAYTEFYATQPDTTEEPVPYYNYPAARNELQSTTIESTTRTTSNTFYAGTVTGGSNNQYTVNFIDSSGNPATVQNVGLLSPLPDGDNITPPLDVVVFYQNGAYLIFPPRWAP